MKNVNETGGLCLFLVVKRLLTTLDNYFGRLFFEYNTAHSPAFFKLRSIYDDSPALNDSLVILVILVIFSS